MSLALVVIGAAGYFVVVPNYRPPLKAGETYGIDVSHHQGVIDWNRVADDNIDFASAATSTSTSLVRRRSGDPMLSLRVDSVDWD